MAISHRHSDSRDCGASTVVEGQSFVTINGQLWAVDNDPNDHIEGNLITSNSWLTINGKGVIVVGDSSKPDLMGHDPSVAASGDGMVDVA